MEAPDWEVMVDGFLCAPAAPGSLGGSSSTACQLSGLWPRAAILLDISWEEVSFDPAATLVLLSSSPPPRGCLEIVLSTWVAVTTVVSVAHVVISGISIPSKSLLSMTVDSCSSSGKWTPIPGWDGVLWALPVLQALAGEPTESVLGGMGFVLLFTRSYRNFSISFRN